MSFLRGLTLGLVVAGLGVSAATAQRIGRDAPDFGFIWKDGQESNDPNNTERLSDYRGKIVLLGFWRANDVRSVESLPVFASIEGEFGDRGVRVWIWTPDAEDKVKDVLENETTPTEMYFGGGMEILYDVSSYPMAYLIDPEGKIAWRGRPADDLEFRVNSLIERTRPFGSDIDIVRDYIAKARTFLVQDDAARAYTYARAVQKLYRKNSPERGPIDELVDKIKEKGKSQIDDAQKMYADRRYDEAARLIADLTVRFTDKDVEEKAKDELALLIGDIRTKDLVKKYRREVQGQVQLERAAYYERVERYEPARDIYEELTKDQDLKETQAVKDAKAAIDRIDNDAKIQAKIREDKRIEKAFRALDIADMYRNVEMYPDARKKYQEVIKDYPSTAAAEKAEERLEEVNRLSKG